MQGWPFGGAAYGVRVCGPSDAPRRPSPIHSLLVQEGELKRLERQLLDRVQELAPDTTVSGSPWEIEQAVEGGMPQLLQINLLWCYRRGRRLAVFEQDWATGRSIWHRVAANTGPTCGCVG